MAPYCQIINLTAIKKYKVAEKKFLFRGMRRQHGYSIEITDLGDRPIGPVQVCLFQNNFG